jgi:acetoin utilization protein AcuC
LYSLVSLFLPSAVETRRSVLADPVHVTRAQRFAIVYGPELALYSFGSNHPLQPTRYVLTMALLRELGWLNTPGIQIVSPRLATVTELMSAHTYPYIQAVQEAQAMARGKRAPVDLTYYGLGTSDDPLFPYMHDAAALYTGATIQAMDALLAGAAEHAYSPAGGQHHAHRARASGFCIYNDAAVAIAVALQAGHRLAYLDLDAHHGDGVQEAFYSEPRVLSVSIHESGRYLFPGSGDSSEKGSGAGEGANLNIPLEPGAGDREIMAALEETAVPAIESFGPSLLVTQTGADTHHSDPLTHLEATLAVYPRLAARLHDLVHRCCEGRWLILGGGGYDPADVTPRAWAAFVGTVLDYDLRNVALPEKWLQASRAAGGDPPPGLLDDPGPGGRPPARAEIEHR